MANDGIVLAAAAGAVGVRLGGSAPVLRRVEDVTEFGAGTLIEDVDAASSTPGITPEIGHLRSIVGLVWRRSCCGCCCWRCSAWPT